MKINTVVVFDLDDTLYNEIDFLKSAYKEISIKIGEITLVEAVDIYTEMLKHFYNNENVFKTIINKYDLSISVRELLDVYRNHAPKLKLEDDRVKVLNELKKRGVMMGLITDGRSGQQRSKIKALKLNDWISEILISEEFGSEKPNINNYLHFENLYGTANYYYVGDNVKKDFITPNKLNWNTICLKDNGLNIHKQDTSLFDKAYLPQHNINEFKELLSLIL